MDHAAPQVYPKPTENILVIFDLRDHEERPSLRERMHRETKAYGSRAVIEMLAWRVFALVIRPGGARKLAA